MFGKTPIVYLTMLRVREMARLLRGTDLPVATATNSRPHNGRTLPRGYSGQGSIIQLWVELRGIEPLTYSMRTSRATNCAIAPGGLATNREPLYQPGAADSQTARLVGCLRCLISSWPVFSTMSWG